MIARSNNDDDVIHADTPNIVSCDESRPFWIRWRQGVEVGEGTAVGERTFMRLVDTNPKPVMALSLSTGWGSSGEWRINSIEGNLSLSLSSYSQCSFYHFISCWK